MDEKSYDRLPTAAGARIRKEIRAALLRRGARKAEYASSRGSASVPDAEQGRKSRHDGRGWNRRSPSRKYSRRTRGGDRAAAPTIWPNARDYPAAMRCRPASWRLRVQSPWSVSGVV